MRVVSAESSLERAIYQARRRLDLARCGRLALRFLAASLTAAAIGVAVLQFTGRMPQLQALLSVDHAWVAAAVLAVIASGIAGLFAGIVAAMWRTPLFEAAVEIDRRLGLRERVASAWQAHRDGGDRSVATAILQDATRQLDRIGSRGIADAFPLTPRPATLSLLLPLAAIALAIAIPQWVADQSASKIAQDTLQVEPNNVNLEPLTLAIQQQREQAKELPDEKLEFFDDLLGQLQKAQDKPNQSKKNELMQLKTVEDQIREKLGENQSASELQKQLSAMSEFGEGPAEELGKAMSEGEFEEAGEQLRELLEQLDRQELDEQAKEQLAEQLEAMSETLKKAAEQMQQQMQSLQQQMEAAEAAGDNQQAAQLASQMQAMQSQMQSMQAMSQIASQMQSASEALKSGDQQATQQAMQQLQQLQQSMQQMQSSQSMQQQLQQLRQQLQQMQRQASCSQCKGGGCSQCRGGSGSMKPDASQFASKGSGNGMGEGRGYGERPEDETDTNNYDAQVAADPQAGETFVGGKLAGPNRKNPSAMEVAAAVQAAEVEPPDPVEDARLPKHEQSVAQQYLQSLRQ